VTLNGQIATTPTSRSIDVTRGQDFTNIDFGIRLAQGGTIGQPPPPRVQFATVPLQNDLIGLLM
jgi:hypothetical protein